MDSFSFSDIILIFCDGACSGNPGPGGWGAIIASKDGHVYELGGSAKATTNNRMELSATIEALISIRETPGKVLVCTDSVYVIRGITQWIFGWRKRGWITADGKDVSNKDLWQALSLEISRRGKESPVDWRFVRGHQGIPGNERCDEIAVAYSKGNFVELYQGSLLKYPVPIYDLPPAEGLPDVKPKLEKEAAYSYISLVADHPMRHETWRECENRVKGQSGAKFKKSKSSEDEIKILESWGINPKRILK